MSLSPRSPAASADAPSRVLHLSAGAMWGGVESMLLTLALERATAPAVEPLFVFGHEGPVADALRATGVRVAALPTARLSRPLSVLAARRALGAVLRDWRPDVVISHGAWMLALHGGVIAGAGIPMVLYAHDAPDEATIVDRLARRHRRRLRVLANSAFTAERVRRVFDPVATAVSAPPVAAPLEMTAAERVRLRRGMATSDSAFVIAMIGRLVPTKGHEVLLRALAAATLPATAVVWIIGGPQHAEEHDHERAMRALAEALGIGDRVRWAGLRGDARRLVGAADVLTLPNTEPEAFGLVLVEAMWAGRAVVASAIGAAPSVLGGQGILVPAGDSDALAAALTRLHDDGALRVGLGVGGPARAGELSEPAVAIPRLYALALARAPAGTAT